MDNINKTSRIVQECFAAMDQSVELQSAIIALVRHLIDNKLMIYPEIATNFIQLELGFIETKEKISSVKTMVLYLLSIEK